MLHKKLLFIGCGKMGYSIAKSIVDDKLFEQIVICDRYVRQELLNLKVELITDLNNINTAEFDIVVLAVKPQDFDSLLAFSFRKDALIISIMAGKKLKYIAKTLNVEKVARIMPNIAASCQKSNSLLCFTDEMKDEDKVIVRKMANSFGYIVEIEESLFDVGTIAMSSSLAFFYKFAAEIAKQMTVYGFNEEYSQLLVKQVFSSAGAILDQSSDVSFQQLIDTVSSKGGITEVGVQAMEREHLTSMLQKVFKECIERSKVL